MLTRALVFEIFASEQNDAPTTPLTSRNSDELMNTSLISDNVQVPTDISLRATTNKDQWRNSHITTSVRWKNILGNYFHQFEATAIVNNWTNSENANALTLALYGDPTDKLQTLTPAGREDYQQLVNTWKCDTAKHISNISQSHPHNHCQKPNEQLQEFEADVARLVHLAYPATPKKLWSVKQALILAHPSQLAVLWNLRQRNKYPEAKLEFANLKKASKKDKAQARACATSLQEKQEKEASEKLKKVGDKWQSSTCRKGAPRNIARVASLHKQPNSVSLAV
ncbi:hypothetical protein NQ317_014158 [Molorchus minor]|uniref:Uncharacterized protein n=1 Tax=Molorchus minor TaxID=1323400 RepID=A0ABQ9JEN9_9CUCU|nr:hypothetical protein NQ317_014158 [Molorchus minor]